VSGSVRGGVVRRAAAAARCDVLYDSIHAAARAACPIIGITTTHVSLRFMDDQVLLAAHIPIHYAGKMANPRRSAKRDRHGAFKLKPSEARFQFVLPKMKCKTAAVWFC